MSQPYFSFSKPQVHLSSNKTSRKILSHLTQFFWRERNSFGYNEIVPGPALDSKGRPQMHLRFPWWKISFSAEKIPFHIFTERLSEVGLPLLVQMKLNTQKMKTTQIHLRPWDVFSKAVKNSQSTYLGAKHRSWKQISCGNFSHGIWFSSDLFLKSHGRGMLRNSNEN